MKSKVKTVVITGAESTGKSGMSQWLSDFFVAPYVPEFARVYVENLGRPYNFSDVETIAQQQVKQLDNIRQTGHSLIFIDTWLIITKIWFEEVYNKVPDWLEEAIRTGQIDFFLVCDIDLPWLPDMVRENGGERRRYLQERYIESLNQYGFRYDIISGRNSIRYQNAVNALVKAEIVKPIQL